MKAHRLMLFDEFARNELTSVRIVVVHRGCIAAARRGAGGINDAGHCRGWCEAHPTQEA